MPKGEETWLRIADGEELRAMIQEALSAERGNLCVTVRDIGGLKGSR